MSDVAVVLSRVGVRLALTCLIGVPVDRPAIPVVCRDGPPGGCRGVPCIALRGHQLGRHPRETCHHVSLRLLWICSVFTDNAFTVNRRISRWLVVSVENGRRKQHLLVFIIFHVVLVPFGPPSTDSCIAHVYYILLVSDFHVYYMHAVV